MNGSHAEGESIAEPRRASPNAANAGGSWEEERDGETKMCVRKAPGSHKIKSKGEAAVIEAFVPAEDDSYSGEIATFAFDAKQGVFVKKSAKPHTVKVEETCYPAK